MNSLLEVRNLNVMLKGFSLDNVNLTIPEGVVVGLIGKNGVGKSTLIKTLMDLYSKDSGEIFWKDVVMEDNIATMKSQIGFVPDRTIYFDGQKTKKIVEQIAPFYSDWNMDRWHALMTRFKLSENKSLSEYSKGMQKKFMLTTVLARDVDLLVMDEPMEGLDPAARLEFIEVIQEFMVEEKKSVLFSTHLTNDLEKIADYIAVMLDGKIIVFEEKEKLLDSYRKIIIPKERMTDTLKKQLKKVKEQAYGYVALTNDCNIWETNDEIQYLRPHIEDFIILCQEGE